MTDSPPALPDGCPAQFRATVHGTIFGGRDRLLDALADGDPVVLMPDPPGQDDPEVWVHLLTGDPVGHLPPEISAWLAPWMMSGGRARGTAVRVLGADVPSWRRVLVEVRCGEE